MEMVEAAMVAVKEAVATVVVAAEEVRVVGRAAVATAEATGELH